MTLIEMITVTIVIVVAISFAIAIALHDYRESQAKQERGNREDEARARFRLELQNKPFSFVEFRLKNSALVELVYNQTDGSEKQRKTLEKIIEEYTRFNEGKVFTPEHVAEALSDIWREAELHNLKALQKFVVEMQHELLVK